MRKILIRHREHIILEKCCVLLVLTSLALFSVGCVDADKTDVGIVNQGLPDLSNHPIYKDYAFSQKKTVIHIGDQPLWIPTSSISEVMKRDNILKEELAALGYSLKVHPFLKGNDVNYFLLSGDLEVGIGGDMPALRAAAAGDVVVISIVQEGPVSIISRDIREIKDLKGKKIGYALGSNAHFYLLNTLRKNGVDVSDVRLVQMDVTLMPDAIHEGRIDAFSAWEPTPSIALDKHPELIVTHRGKSYGFLYVRKELMERNPEVVRHLLASEIRALRWLRKSDRSLDMASKWVNDASLKLSPQGVYLSPSRISLLAKEDLPGIRIKEYPRIPPVSLSDNGALKREFELLKDLGLISEEKAWGDVKGKFDLNAIESVISNPEKYRIFEEMDVENDGMGG
jgi:NitT/TauT family transport system substrate-binding protein